MSNFIFLFFLVEWILVSWCRYNPDSRYEEHCCSHQYGRKPLAERPRWYQSRFRICFYAVRICQVSAWLFWRWIDFWPGQQPLAADLLLVFAAFDFFCHFFESCAAHDISIMIPNEFDCTLVRHSIFPCFSRSLLQIIHNISFKEFYPIVLTVTLESCLTMVFRLGLLLVTSSRQSRFWPLTTPCLDSWWRWIDFRSTIRPQSSQQTSSAFRKTRNGAIRLANRAIRFWFLFLSLICRRIICWRDCDLVKANFCFTKLSFLSQV